MARVMREGVCTMIRVRSNVGVLVALAGLLAACAGGSSQWQRERLTALPKPGDRILGERLIDAHYVVAGRIVDVERAILYEQRGGWLMRALFHDEGTPEAYEAKIAVDSVLVGGGQPKRLYVTFFAPHGNRIPERKSTRLNSSHSQISYAVFCLKKKKKHN